MRHAAAVLLLAFLGAPLAQADDLPAIQKRGTLRVIVEPDALVELYSTKAGSPPGLEHEMLQGFAALHKLKLVSVLVPFDERIPALQKSRGDLIAGGLVASPARRAQVALTDEVVPTRLVVVTRKPHALVRTAAELREQRVGVLRGSAATEQVAAAGVPPGNVDDSYSSEHLVGALKASKVTAVVLSVAWALSEQKTDPAIQIGMFLGPPTAVAFAVRKGEPRLLAALNDYIGNVRRTQTWSRLVVKYFGENARELLVRSRAP